MRILGSILIAWAAVACSSEPGGAPAQSGGDSSRGGSTEKGSGGNDASGASSLSSAGATNASGGASASGGMTSVSSGGSLSASSGGNASGGTLSDGHGGAASSGGSSSAGANASGGAVAHGGASSGAGQAGASQGGSSGSDGAGESDVAKPLDGLRIDDPCTGTPATTDGATCNHVMLTNNQFKAAKEVSVAGTPGTSYDVTLRIRGVVEPSNISGGTRPNTATFSYKDQMWRKEPFTIGGTVQQADYQQWHIRVASPAQDYYLNDYQKAGHFIFKLDYQVTIEVAANSKVTLDCSDSNERMIDNYEKYSLDGIPGSTNLGQFLQLNVVSVKPHAR